MKNKLACYAKFFQDKMAELDIKLLKQYSYANYLVCEYERNKNVDNELIQKILNNIPCGHTLSIEIKIIKVLLFV